VGAVCWPQYLKSRRSDPTAFLLETIALCPALAERLRDAQLVNPATATGNYSYQAQRMVGSRYIILGDAFAFFFFFDGDGVFLAVAFFLFGDALGFGVGDLAGLGEAFATF
jgi:2-polyprenyl-6-methoxyphenol hydroxylase-like FAD-dependent oxidoreductase